MRDSPADPNKGPSLFAEVLRAAQDHSGLSNGQLAQLVEGPTGEVGISKTVVTRWLKGYADLRESTIYRFARALGLRVELRLVPDKKSARKAA